MAFLKKILFWGILGGLIYLVLAFHFIFFSWTEVELLKKSEFNLKYTFYSAAGKSNRKIMSVEELRENGIAEILIEKGRMTERERAEILREYEEW